MKKTLLPFLTLLSASVIVFNSCNQSKADGKMTEGVKPDDYGGYKTEVAYGEHLVTICGCHDCHSPKVMGPHGMMLDSSRLLSGHPAELPCPDVDRKVSETKGIISTNDLTAWVGPWGVSYTANLTPDPTGIGNWDEENFMVAIKLGKSKGIRSSRTLLPPMPWELFKNMSDKELRAIFAYLKSIRPIKNIVPAPDAPVMAMQSSS